MNGQNRVANLAVGAALLGWLYLVVQSGPTGDDRPLTAATGDYGMSGADVEYSDLTVGDMKLSYENGFLAACEEVWANSGDDDALYFDDIAYYQSDCEAALDADSAVETALDDGSIEDDVDAEALGREDGLVAAFSESDVLCWGDECWDTSDF